MIEFDDVFAYENTSGTIKRSVARRCVVKNLNAAGQRPAAQPFKAGLSSLQDLVHQAQAAGKSLSPVGSAWSMSRVVDPTDWLVETKHLNEIPAIGFKPEHLDPGYDGDAQGLVYAQGGNSIARLHVELARRGRALKTSGESCGQTIAGAISTGTHGSAFKAGALQDAVVALHLVDAEGKSMWLERASRPVVSDAFLDIVGAQRPGSPSDDLFNAALVSFGSFGLVFAVVLETYATFLLERHRTKHPLKKLLRDISMAGSHVRFPEWTFPSGEKPNLLHHYELIINPNQPKQATVQTMFWAGKVTNYPFKAPSPVLDDTGSSVVAEVSGLINELGAIANIEIDPRIKNQIATMYPETGNKPEKGLLGELFPRIEFPRGGLALEVGVDTLHTHAALDFVLEKLNAPHVSFPGLVAVRFVKQTRATLGFTRFPVTCTIEAVGIDCNATRKMFDAILADLPSQPYDHTLHWGLYGDFSPSRVMAMYGPARVQKWRAQRSLFLGTEGKHLFSNQLFEHSGLAL